MSEPPSDEKLERLLRRTLSGLPPRRAPLTLQARVLDELRRRGTRAWWQRSFAHWPLAARGAFLLLSAAGIDLLWLISGRGAAYLQSLHQSVTLPASWLRPGAATLVAARDLLGALSNPIPASVLYGAAALAAVLYALLFGLGVVAYRTLYLER